MYRLNGSSENTVTFLEDLSRLSKMFLKNSKASIIFKKGQVLFHEETLPMGVFFVKKGRIKKTRASFGGKKSIIGVMNAGSFLGYQELLNEEPYLSTATAMEDTEIYFLSKEGFFSLLEKDEQFFNRIMQVLRHDLVAV
jgi:CRP-like cAMP-binding protein